LEDGRKPRPAERAEEFLRAVRHEDYADKDAGDEKRPINGRTITIGDRESDPVGRTAGESRMKSDAERRGHPFTQPLRFDLISD